MAFELPTLPYSKTALAAKGMCEETLDLHHGKHHQAYVTALNGFVEKDPALQGKSLDEIVKSTAGAGGPGVQQCRPALEPYHVLGMHEPERRQDPVQAGSQDHVRPRRRVGSSRTSSRPPASASSAPAGRGWCWAATAS